MDESYLDLPRERISDALGVGASRTTAAQSDDEVCR
jgi:hypothetical protein